jgi:isoamylase
MLIHIKTDARLLRKKFQNALGLRLEAQCKGRSALVLLVAGTPMPLMGDEVRRTQAGNNNAYCQDSDISWFDWSLLERHGDIHRFVKALNTFRQRRAQA